MNPLIQGVCQAYDSQGKVISLDTANFFIALFYSAVFMLGNMNINTVLIKNQHYKTAFMCWQYIFGQLVCLCKIVSAILVQKAVQELKSGSLCNTPESDQVLPLLRAGLGLAAFDIVGKLCFVFVLTGQMIQIHSKLTLIIDQYEEKPEPRWPNIAIGLLCFTAFAYVGALLVVFENKEIRLFGVGLGLLYLLASLILLVYHISLKKLLRSPDLLICEGSNQ